MSSDEHVVNDEFSSNYSLSQLTLLGCSTAELTYIASRTGYDAISPRLIPMGISGECPYSPLDPEMIRSTRNALNVTGIDVHDIELASIYKQCDVKSLEPAIAVGAEFGAGKLIASVWTENSNDRNFIIDTYAEICDLAKTYGLSVVLEFPSFSRINNLKQAVDIVLAADRLNAGILIDTLYMHLSRVNLSELDELPSNWFSFIQVSDMLPGIPDTHDGMKQIARESRLYPGEGCIDFTAIIERLPPVNYSIELPNRSRVAELGYEEHARRCLQSAKQNFGTATSKRRLSADNTINTNHIYKETYGARTH